MSLFDPPTPEQLECLNLFDERAVIQILLGQMKQWGFGRVPQLAAQIEDIWRHPERIKDYEAAKKKHFKELAKARD